MKVTKIKEPSCICNNPTCIETNSEKIYYAKPLLSQAEYTISTCWCKMRKVKKNKITYKDITFRY